MTEEQVENAERIAKFMSMESVSNSLYQLLGERLKMLDTITTLQADLREARDMLKRLEWLYEFGATSGTGDYFCPDCGQSRDKGHMLTCKLAAAMTPTPPTVKEGGGE